ncbi:MAG: protein kinase [Deltaproteobacteria bacterium]|nr:protein kinase [Deltaproteobacteria bacterium]
MKNRDDAKSALAATVVEWMPVSAAPATSSSSALPNGEPPWTPPDPLAAVGLGVGALVDRTYRVERALGVGGMGVVALATDERLDRKVAIKFIKADLFAFPEMRTFFQSEARAMARVHHRNVLTVFAFGEHEGTPYFVMEYVDGRTADHWLRARPAGTFPDLDEAVRILEQACLGVEAIHASSTVHRDLKPSNLLIDESAPQSGQSKTTPRVAVGDLGVARVLDSAVTGNFIVGSAAYMAPEAALGEDEAPELAPRRDIYALGCIAYELITGRPPFTGETDMNLLSQHVLQEPAPPSNVRPDLPAGYDEVIMKALAKDPQKRYATVEAFRRALLAEHSGAREPERILIADDDDDWRTLIVESLRSRFPHAVIDEVGDGEAALAAFEKNPYSVVLVDLQMPAMDGARLTLLLRSMDGSSRTPIIVLTAAGGPREWQRLSAIGADAFLVKPVNADDVELVIRRTMKSRHAAAPSMPPGPAAPKAAPAESIVW